MATRLSIYNGALLICEERPLTSVSESVEARRLLDAVWDGGGVNYCLEQGLWNFATRAAQLDYEPSVEPAFGMNRAFEKPSDWIRPVGVCSDEFYHEPLLHYVEEGAYLYAELDTVYVRYVSNDSSYGADLSLWPQTFTLYVEHYFASRIVGKLSANARLKESLTSPNRMVNVTYKALIDARSKDAMADPTSFPPQGSWVRARQRGIRGERGSRSNLIG